MEFLVSLFSAFIITLIITPVIIVGAKKLGFVDIPSRNHPAILHAIPIPRAGGLPTFIGFLFAIVILSLLSPDFILTKALFGILFASFLLVLVGLADDKYDLNPYLRLFSNFIVVAIVVGFGVGISSITNPFGGLFHLDSNIYSFTLPTFFGFLAGHHSIILLADIVAFFWIVWVMNALNWSSGVDGQLTGIAVIALFILGIVSSDLANSDPNQKTTAIIAFAAAGSFLGFLPWSFFPQKIMPGYGGSTFAGFLIAVLAILSGAKLAIVLLVLLIPLVDSLWVFIRRIATKHSPVWGDNFHLHHQLLKLGWSVPQICLFYYSIGLALGLLSLTFDSKNKFFAITIIGVLIFSLLFTIFFFINRLKRKNANFN